MKTLNRYLAREVLGGVGLVLAALLMLFAFFDLIHELGDLGKGNYNLARILAFVLLTLPSRVYELLPIAVLIGALFAMAHLAASSEITVIRTSGVSSRQLAQSLARTGLILVAITFFFGEVVGPQAERFAQQFRMSSLSTVVAQEFRSGLWVKDGGNYINVREMLPDTTLLGIRIYELDNEARLRMVREAKRGIYLKDNLWRLEDVRQTTFSRGMASVGTLAETEWPSELTPDLLSVLLVTPEQMSAWNLYSYIQHLVENRQKTLRYEIALWSKLVYPLAVLVLLLMALPFGLFHHRMGGIGAKVFVGIMLGLGYHLSNRIFSHLGLIKEWPPFMSAVIPTLIFFGLAVLMLWWQERTS